MRILKGMKEILSDESKWTKRTFARNVGGIEILPENEEAVAFCLLGAERKVINNLLKEGEGFDSIYEEDDHDIGLLRKCVYGMAGVDWTIPRFNDSEDTDFDRAMAALDCAIAKCEAE